MFISCSLHQLSLQIFIKPLIWISSYCFPVSLFLWPSYTIILTMVHFVWLPIKFYNLILTVCKRFSFQFECYKSLTVMNSMKLWNGECNNNNNFFFWILNPFGSASSDSWQLIWHHSFELHTVSMWIRVKWCQLMCGHTIFLPFRFLVAETGVPEK